jgi:uncharacterized Zn finger protein (UPF0148 family)
MIAQVCPVCGSGSIIVPHDDGLYCGNCGARIPLGRLEEIYSEEPERAA